MKLTKQDFKNNSYNLLLVTVYTFLLALIYGWWVQDAVSKWWLTLIIVFVITCGGVIIGLVWTNKKKKNISSGVE